LDSVRVVILTNFGLDEYIFRALRAGASGFLLKDTQPAELLQALRVVVGGDSLLSPAVTRRLISEFVARPPDAVAAAGMETLTNREREVVALVAHGLSNDEIAEAMVLSPATAKTHVSRAMIKLGARDRAQLVVFAYQTGLVTPRAPGGVALPVMDDDEFQVSYMGATLGVPVLTKDGGQFGILEHVLAVEEEDIFEGIVVWVGGGGWSGRKIQRELSMGHQSAARFLETFRHNDLRFVPADQVAAITAGYIRCDLDRSQVGMLQPPSGAPVLYANAIDQAGPPGQVYRGPYGNQLYGGMFGRGRWRQE